MRPNLSLLVEDQEGASPSQPLGRDVILVVFLMPRVEHSAKDAKLFATKCRLQPMYPTFFRALPQHFGHEPRSSMINPGICVAEVRLEMLKKTEFFATSV